MQATDFDEWVGTFCYAADQSEDAVTCVVGVDDGDDVVIVSIDGRDANPVTFASHLDQLLAQPRSVAAIGTKVAWSPTPDGESSPAWSLVVVQVGLPAWFGVRRLVEDDRWWHLQPPTVPWFMLSSASGLRAALERREPVVVKSSSPDNESIMKTPGEAPRPQLDSKGRL